MLKERGSVFYLQNALGKSMTFHGSIIDVITLDTFILLCDQKDFLLEEKGFEKKVFLPSLEVQQKGLCTFPVFALQMRTVVSVVPIDFAGRE